MTLRSGATVVLATVALAVLVSRPRQAPGGNNGEGEVGDGSRQPRPVPTAVRW